MGIDIDNNIKGVVVISYSFVYSTKSGLGSPAIEVFLYGCDKEIKCNGCHNPELWEIPDISNRKFEEIAERLNIEILNFLRFHSKLTICFVGGEPTASHNLPLLNFLCEHIKTNYKDSIIVLYSWKRLDANRIRDCPLVDYGVLGEYEESSHMDFSIPSSSNQIIYNFNNKIILPSINLDDIKGI